MSLTGGHRNDITQLVPLIDAVRPIGGRVGRPRKRPERVLGDRAYDHDRYRRLVRQRGIRPIIARRQTSHGSGLGRQRWVVERAPSPICTGSDAFGSAGTVTPRCTPPSCSWPAPSSAGDGSGHCETGS